MDRDSEKLRRWIIRKKLEGKPVKSICIQARISRKMFYYWWSRYQTQGWKGLQEKPKGRPCGPGLEDSLKEKIIKLRKRYECGVQTRQPVTLNTETSLLTTIRFTR